MTPQPENHEHLEQAVRRRQERRERWQREGERSLGQNLAIIGALGWTIVVPTLLGIFAGRWLDRTFQSGILDTGLARGGPSGWLHICVEKDSQRMTHNSFILHLELTLMMAFGGVVFGLLYFAALKRSITQYVGGKSWPAPLALTLGRIGAAAGFLFVAAKLGAVPLLAAFVGFLIARAMALRAERRAS